MTPRQEAMVGVIEGYWAQHNYAPTLREIATVMGYASTQPVAYHLGILREQGIVAYEDGKARTVRVIEQSSGGVATTLQSPAAARWGDE